MSNESDFMARLYSTEGSIKPSRLVELARDADNPLHDKFEWDNSIAGHEYRLIQARRYIRVTRVAVNGGKPQPLIHVAASDDADAREGAYFPKQAVLADPDKHAMAYRSVQQQFKAAQRALDELDPAGYVKAPQQAGRGAAMQGGLGQTRLALAQQAGQVGA